MEVKVNLRAFVFIGLQRSKISGFTLAIAVSIGGARDCAVNAHTDLFAFQFVDRHDVNFGQE